MCQSQTKLVGYSASLHCPTSVVSSLLYRSLFYFYKLFTKMPVPSVFKFGAGSIPLKLCICKEKGIYVIVRQVLTPITGAANIRLQMGKLGLKKGAAVLINKPEQGSPRLSIDLPLARWILERGSQVVEALEAGETFSEKRGYLKMQIHDDQVIINTESQDPRAASWGANKIVLSETAFKRFRDISEPLIQTGEIMQHDLDAKMVDWVSSDDDDDCVAAAMAAAAAAAVAASNSTTPRASKRPLDNGTKPPAIPPKKKPSSNTDRHPLIKTISTGKFYSIPEDSEADEDATRMG